MAAMEAVEKKAAVADAARAEAQKQAVVLARRDRALLQTYADESDIARVRQRALASNREAAAQVEARIAQLKARQAQLAKQAAKDDKYEQDIKAVAYDLSLLEQLLESRKREAAEINARYDEEKRKFHELTSRK
jgi:hypothetical protein